MILKNLEHKVDNSELVIDPDCCFFGRYEPKQVKTHPYTDFCLVTLRREGVKGIYHIIAAGFRELANLINYKNN